MRKKLAIAFLSLVVLGGASTMLAGCNTVEGAGKDVAQGKITFPAVYGLEKSRSMATEHCALAHDALTAFGERASRLHEIADLIAHRKS